MASFFWFIGKIQFLVTSYSLHSKKKFLIVKWLFFTFIQGDKVNWVYFSWTKFVWKLLIEAAKRYKESKRMQKEEYLLYIKLNTMLLYINTLLYIKYPVIF